MANVLCVGAGGILGALARYLFHAWLNSGGLFPWGTLTVNLLGSFFLALFLTVVLHSLQHRGLLVLAISTGFTGSFTTFSSVSVEMVRLAEIYPLLSFLYSGVSFSAGLLLAFAGRRLGNMASAAMVKSSGVREAGGVE